MSLLYLGQVISMLAKGEKGSVVPYRQSKLTTLLKVGLHYRRACIAQQHGSAYALVPARALQDVSMLCCDWLCCGMRGSAFGCTALIAIPTF